MATPSDVILLAWRSCLISFWLHDNPMHEEVASLCNVKIEHMFYDNTLGLNTAKILTRPSWPLATVGCHYSKWHRVHVPKLSVPSWLFLSDMIVVAWWTLGSLLLLMLRKLGIGGYVDLYYSRVYGHVCVQWDVHVKWGYFNTIFRWILWILMFEVYECIVWAFAIKVKYIV